MPYLIIFGLLFFVNTSWGYPQFIGYKYASCLTCHYNGQGNGPLNDYGRALWSAEIAGKLFNSKTSDEKLAESSGFLGKKQLPWWLRPGVKVRELLLETNPGGDDAETRSILMQADVNVAIFLREDQSRAFVGSIGYVPEPLRIQNSQSAPKVDEWISREHYYRHQFNNDTWFYVGMLDKVYGIRHINHTAYSRSKVGLAQNDQTHGVVGHYIQPKWEVTVHAFMGNLFQDKELRQKGLSALFEYEPKEAWRVGVSALSSSSDFVISQRLGVFTRYGFGYGSALLAEVGFIEDSPKTDFEFKRGYYLYTEAIQRLTRGYHFFVVGQAYKDRLETGRQNNVKMGAGFLMFPMARVELRVEVENSRGISDFPEVQQDVWAMLTQLHLSF